ncbi:hypothetical protein [Streptomyces albipurpureus]|uniref:Septin-type G domain-containing protein n=1 Tax=Streptomyces albipurpureus TaxID=2897419 RepID=A0ABT0UGB3_9ACTN|nr:hypothetical protein [Streptomyces sp. CWNU-1]MCM2387672.1 hypothetical protein [Streptomyces sp. CWNU-1]
MTLSFKASMVGPSRVGKTTLLTAILAETETMLSGTEIDLVPDEETEMRIRRNRKELRRAIEAREFDSASLEGSQSMVRYNVSLRAAGDRVQGIPFSILDYPGAWLDPAERSRRPEARENWPECEAHITESLMLLVPVEAAVLMEAVTPVQRRAVADLLGFEDVEAMARKWARARNLPEHREEPAVLVIAPLKCEKYFDDNGGKGREAPRLRQLVREKYRSMLDIVLEETKNRTVRVVYAPIDTYGCVDLMEGEWTDRIDADGEASLDFKGHYRFREIPPRIKVKAAGTVMQELCRCVISGQDRVEQQQAAAAKATYNEALERKAEPKGFWGAIDYHLSGEASENKSTRLSSHKAMTTAEGRRAKLAESLRNIAMTPADPRVEEW